VTGSTKTKWGAQRAKDGHSRPFPLHYVEIGNEDFFEPFRVVRRALRAIFDAIKMAYPQLKCISTVGNEQPDTKRVHSRQPDALDEHYYRAAQTFIGDGGHFDHYNRQGPDIFCRGMGGIRDAISAMGQSVAERAAHGNHEGRAGRRGVDDFHGEEFRHREDELLRAVVRECERAAMAGRT